MFQDAGSSAGPLLHSTPRSRATTYRAYADIVDQDQPDGVFRSAPQLRLRTGGAAVVGCAEAMDVDQETRPELTVGRVISELEDITEESESEEEESDEMEIDVVEE